MGKYGKLLAMLLMAAMVMALLAGCAGADELAEVMGNASAAEPEDDIAVAAEEPEDEPEDEPAAPAADASFEEIVLVDNDDFAVTVTKYDPEGYWGPTFTLLLENRTDVDLMFSLEDVSVNDMMCDPWWAEIVPAGKSAYSDVAWDADDLTDVGIRYIEAVEATLWVYDSDDFTAPDYYEDIVSWTVDNSGMDLTGDGDTGSQMGFIGDTMHTAFFEFTVNDAYLADGYEGYVPSDGNTLLVADVSVYNYTTYSVPMYDTDFQVQWDDDAGDAFAVPVTYARDGYPNTGAEAVGDMLPAEYSVGIHNTAEGLLVFEVPAGYVDFALGFQEYYADDTYGDAYFVYFTAG